MHQHLTPSPSCRSVATTGVAGYGAALAARRKNDSADPPRWELRAVRFGVGGFGVGVVRASMKAPYKSLGNGTALAFYHSSGRLEGGAAGARPTSAEVPPIDPGATIGIEVRRAGVTSATSGGKAKAGGVTAGQRPGAREAAFSVNGVAVGVVALGGAGPKEELNLAVQPYMGGVALLLS
jgi:hypothetical protein